VDKNDVVKTTAALGGLEQEIRRIRPRLVWLDPSAKIFDGDENSRKIAEQSSKVMRGLTEICDSTVITLQHPSLAGMQSKRGTSGSTGWHNDVRFRNYLSKVKNTDYLKIENMKLNHGKPGAHINVRWDDAAQLFVRRGTVVPPADVPTPMEQKYEALFLKLLDAAGGPVSAAPSSIYYAPKVFAQESGTAKHVFERTMQRLLEEGKIKEEERGTGSHKKKFLVRGAASGAPTAAEL
jgi:RecA-family ATPase